MLHYSGIHQGPDVAGTLYRAPSTLSPLLPSLIPRCSCEVVLIRVVLHAHGPERDADSALSPFLRFCFKSDMRALLGSALEERKNTAGFRPRLAAPSDAMAARRLTSKSLCTLLQALGEVGRSEVSRLSSCS